MREVTSAIKSWQKQGKAIAIATIVKVEGTPLRPLGSKMVVTSDKQIAGSITGGCIEGGIYEEAQTVIKSCQPKLLHFGLLNDESPWEIGLSCGSSIDVFIEPLDSPVWKEIYPVLETSLSKNQLMAIGTILSGAKLGSKLVVWPNGDVHGSLGSQVLDKQAVEWMKQQLLVQGSSSMTFDEAGAQVEVFVDVITTPARLVIVGAVHIAIPLVSMAKILGFHTIVIDPRSAFATRERFPHVDELVTEWPSTALEKLRPDECTYIAVLSHDDKLDNPALQVALASPARYVGILGTHKNIPKRLNELRDLGVTEEQLSRLHAPIGLKLGAIQPEEIALSVLAEIVAAKHGLSKIQENPVKSTFSH
ncbi:MAG: putative Carbon monoxide dehydrogenase accessory protein I [Chloroflexi bacterium]|nr:MAG: putative Carbon monoxide dehydrogenase accessory protein I [Chloroflexota bacterium]